MNRFFEKIREDASDLWQRTREAAIQIKDEEEEGLNHWHDLFAWADGSLSALPFDEDEPSEKNRKMKALAVMEISDSKICAPCSGLVTSISEKINTISISPAPDQIVAVKVCTGHVDFEKDAKILVKTGQWIHAGQILAEFKKPVESKSKLLLVKPQTWQEIIDQGVSPVHQQGPVSTGDLLISAKQTKKNSTQSVNQQEDEKAEKQQ